LTRLSRSAGVIRKIGRPAADRSARRQQVPRRGRIPMNEPDERGDQHMAKKAAKKKAPAKKTAKKR